ncbi:bifunctional chorismate-binding protein/class IV aminotransferase [Kocuria sp.]|uniref:bifunctional anthranilate synthase component I family protein/aminotransferase class IV n=1 Tax=Kocuria sp. TaxID=1871328 RepID=UPI0026DC3294|nr:bifunctional chorismate-binding protein/class IV aminotransferase [Kocuria sp.]MDO4919075.1 chorismate-binding protein [Kocuria sp.]
MHRVCLPHRVSPVQMLRALRDQPGLTALLADWVHGDAVIGVRPTRVLGPDEDPFVALGAEEGTAPAPTVDGPVRFGGGWIGYLGYQLSRRLESLPPAPPRSGGLPEHHLAHYDHVLVHHAAADRWFCESLPGADLARVRETVAVVGRALAAGSAASSSEACAPRPYRCEPFEAAVTGAAHAAAVRRALEHIRDGDVFQANVCRELAAGFHGDPLDLFCAGYERLRPRFAAFLRVPGGAVASLSPELYLRRTGDAVLTSPIKGTAPANTDPRELHASAKNRAENVMIVDLMRNDLSRACVPGSVLSPAVPRVEPHTGVHHLVADVHGTLRPGFDDAALLRSTFPPGSCTGAPKIRATEIINELETTARGVYTGAVGCVSPVAGLVVNVAIRTFEFSGSTVRLGVGGGIVADSDPDDEAFETLVKAAPLLDAVGAGFGPELSREWREHARRSAPEWPVVQGRPDPALGVFTTILVREGHPAQLAEHLARLGDSTRACFGRDLPGELGERITRCAAALEGPHRLRVTAAPEGEGVRIDLTPAPLNPPGAHPPVEPWELVPVVVPGGWGGHKWADRRPLDTLPGPWSPVCDPLLTDRDGTLFETGRANVFLVLDGAVVTPPADGRILPGVVRARVLALLRDAGHRVLEREVTLAEAAGASEVFVTNALRGARPVGGIRGVGQWTEGPVTRWVQTALAGSARSAPEQGEGRGGPLR